MKFCWSTLNVKDLDESIKFYTDIIGLELVQQFSAGPGVEIVFLGKGETKIELIYSEKAEDILIGKDISWGFEVGSLDQTLIMLKEKGIKVESGPIQPNPSIRYLFIKDPNGMTIQLVENMA